MHWRKEVSKPKIAVCLANTAFVARLLRQIMEEVRCQCESLKVTSSFGPVRNESRNYELSTSCHLHVLTDRHGTVEAGCRRMHQHHSWENGPDPNVSGVHWVYWSSLSRERAILNCLVRLFRWLSSYLQAEHDDLTLSLTARPHRHPF